MKEQKELEELQAYASKYVQKYYPLPFKELEELEKAIQNESRNNE